MSTGPEPFVVHHAAAPAAPDRRIRLADVLITAPDGRPRNDQFAALFHEYPGLTLVLVTGAGGLLEVGTRDGAAASLRPGPSTPVRLVAVALYFRWVEQLSPNDASPR